MDFSYNDYWDVTFLIPATVFASAVILFCVFSVRFFTAKGKTTKKIFGYVFCLCIVVFISFSEIKFLSNGGFYLLKEKESDAVSCSGTIESVCEPSEYIPGFKISHNYGADIIINGERYFAVTCGEFEEGDYVTIKYLPSSHFILSIRDTSCG